jgi:hypothetical protein
VHQYHDNYKQLPPLWKRQLGGIPPLPVAGSLHFMLLPYLELNNLFASTTDLTYDDTSRTVVKNFIYPSDPTAPSDTVTAWPLGACSYAGNVMVFEPGPFGPSRPGTLITAMPDGSSNTVMFAERYKNCNFSWQSGGTFCAWALSDSTSFFFWYGVGPAWLRYS